MRKFGMVAALLLVAGLSAGQVFGANTIYLSTLGPGEGATPGNVDLTGPNALNIGQTDRLHLWATLDTGKISALGMDVLSSDPAVLEGTGIDMVNPNIFLPTQFRWFAVGLGTLGDLVTGMNLVGPIPDPNYTFTGLDSIWQTFDPTYEAGAGVYLGWIDVQGTAVGTTEVRMAGGSAFILGNAIGTPASPLLHFGTGDAAVPVSTSGGQNYIAAGSTSTLADAVIEVVPEPATFGLLALGGLALIRRR